MITAFQAMQRPLDHGRPTDVTPSDLSPVRALWGDLAICVRTLALLKPRSSFSFICLVRELTSNLFLVLYSDVLADVAN